jgi:hypothetical protein
MKLKQQSILLSLACIPTLLLCVPAFAQSEPAANDEPGSIRFVADIGINPANLATKEPFKEIILTPWLNYVSVNPWGELTIRLGLQANIATTSQTQASTGTSAGTTPTTLAMHASQSNSQPSIPLNDWGGVLGITYGYPVLGERTAPFLLPYGGINGKAMTSGIKTDLVIGLRGRLWAKDTGWAIEGRINPGDGQTSASLLFSTGELVAVPDFVKKLLGLSK